MGTLDLVALREPAPVVALPNGAQRQLRYLTGPGYALLQAYRDRPEDTALLVQLLREVLPEATDADLDCLGTDDIVRLLGAAQGKLLMVEAVLKNGRSGTVEGAAPRTPDFNPMT